MWKCADLMNIVSYVVMLWYEFDLHEKHPRDLNLYWLYLELICISVYKTHIFQSALFILMTFNENVADKCSSLF